MLYKTGERVVVRLRLERYMRLTRENWEGARGEIVEMIKNGTQVKMTILSGSKHRRPGEIVTLWEADVYPDEVVIEEGPP